MYRDLLDCDTLRIEQKVFLSRLRQRRTSSTEVVIIGL